MAFRTQPRKGIGKVVDNILLVYVGRQPDDKVHAKIKGKGAVSTRLFGENELDSFYRKVKYKKSKVVYLIPVIPRASVGAYQARQKDLEDLKIFLELQDERLDVRV